MHHKSGMIFCQDGDLHLQKTEERIGFLTRRSPENPDLETLLYALAALVAALILVWIWNRRRKAKGFGYPALLVSLVVASFLGGGTFLVMNLGPQLFEPAKSFTREPSAWEPPSDFESFLRAVNQQVPEEAGVMLINCRVPRTGNLVNYFLYPRRVIFTRQSMLPVERVEEYLTPDIRRYLKSLGSAWLLDLSPGALNGGIETALHRVDDP
jgi:hypothetical protein